MIKERERCKYREYEEVFLRETKEGQRSSLRLNCYIALALQQVADGNSVPHVSDGNSPSSEVPPPIFEFVRYLKAHPDLYALRAEDALQKVARQSSASQATH